MVENITPLFPHVPDNGFPSDHVLLAAGIAAILMPFSKKWSIILWIIAFIIGAARVYAGVHHWIDILASMLIALLSLLLSYLIIKWLGSKTIWEEQSNIKAAKI